MNSLRDHELRQTAFAAIQRMVDLYGDLNSEQLSIGFQFEGARIPFVNPQRGIFKPRQMQFLLSIRTVFPRVGGKIWYDDQRLVHQQIFQGEDVIDYAFMGKDPEASDNRWLREAMENRTPIIYFLGVAPGLYQPIVPTFIVDWDAKNLKSKVAFGPQAVANKVFPVTIAERRYALREVKYRLHQASFREAVIGAYGGRCAVSGLPETRLLDAAHIVADGDEVLGQPIVPNGLPLSKIHHAAFDAHMLGVDPDFRIHIADRLMDQKDGPMLELLKQMDGQQLKLPSRKKDWPDRERLAARFDVFQGYD
jgi:putative restriction endonuclease